jgi:Xaa-Pro aminopeptidase
MVVTVEPGLYFPHDDETLPEWCRGIGIRIEDDVLITPGAAEVLTAEAPKRPDDVEALMRDV